MYVATLTADEMSFAGATFSTNYNYYLMNTYTKDKFLPWWSLSPGFLSGSSGNDYVFILNGDGYLTSMDIRDLLNSSRPAVSLRSDVEIQSDGNGIIDNPYVIK